MAFLSSSAHAVETLKSLQPFTHFVPGDGHGVALKYSPRSKEQFVALLRDKARAQKEMRVSCETLVRQMVEAHPELPFEGCEGAATAIEHDSNFSVVACQDSMFSKNFLTVTNQKATAWGVWHRACLPKEQVLVYKDQPLVSTMCLNVVVPSSLTPPKQKMVAQAKEVSAACPRGFIVFANAWEKNRFPADLLERVEKLIAAATHRDSQNASNAAAYKPDDFSRTLGDETIERVKVRSPVQASLRARLLDPQTLRVVEDLGLVSFTDGIAPIYLTSGQRDYILETVWPGYFSSPTVSGGERRLWIFPGEWERLLGGRWCTMQEHGIYDKVNKP
jgi:hypothetical protein